MPVPKTPVDEYHRTVSAQHDIGSAGQPPHVDTVTETAGKKIFPHNDFRLRISAPYVRHAAMPLFWCQLIGHKQCLVSEYTTISQHPGYEN